MLTGQGTGNMNNTFRDAPSTLQRSMAPTTAEISYTGKDSPRQSTALNRSYNRQNTNTTENSEIKSGDTNTNQNFMPQAVSLERSVDPSSAVTVSQLMRLMNKDIHFADVNLKDSNASETERSMHGMQSDDNVPTSAEIISVSIFDKYHPTEESRQALQTHSTPENNFDY